MKIHAYQAFRGIRIRIRIRAGGAIVDLVSIIQLLRYGIPHHFGAGAKIRFGVIYDDLNSKFIEGEVNGLWKKSKENSVKKE